MTRRNQAEMMYLKSMGLNTLRFEGFTTNAELYGICDREGILIMNGENCVWEDHSDDSHMNTYNRAYTEWQMREFRHHPSLGIWNNGSDIEPSYSQSAEYDQILSAYSFRVDSAFAKNVSDYGARDPWDGIKMQGPYNYVSPYYFWEGNAFKGGGAWGFCAEEGPGIVFPEYESLVRFLPPSNRWPVNATWQNHAPLYIGSTACPLCLTQASIDGRYGASSNAEEFIQKAQLSQYESVRAMFESYAAYKSNVSRPSTGVIMWMLNMAIPGMGWQMYDYYLKPNSATFAAQKACARLLHTSYDYSAKSVWINNESLEKSPSEWVDRKSVV
jgi:exo-1,4-beta-D-glucosaminidase